MKRQRVFCLPAGLVVASLLCITAGGCNHTPTEAEAIKKSLEINGRPETSVVKFSGSVTVDGQAPEIERRSPLYVIAYDPKHPPKGRQTPFLTRCDKKGHFEFNTYSTGDGLAAGSYIVLFAWPKADGDALKNLYNDPDVNAKEEKFHIDLTPPGKTDWSFDLQVAGKDPNTSPGEHAVMADRGKRKGR